MAYLALVWKIFGYSIVATRAAMLVLGHLTALFTFLLTVRLCPGLTGRSSSGSRAVTVVVDPPFYMQSMMAQLDMPAALFTVLALLLFFEDKHVAAAMASTALVLG